MERPRLRRFGSGFERLEGRLCLSAQLSVSGNGRAITAGDSTPALTDGTNFGSVAAGSGLLTRSFVLSNAGDETLQLVGTPSVFTSGANAADFQVTTDPYFELQPGGSTYFQITFLPSNAGTRSATVSIRSTDPTTGTFTFALQGTGAGASAPEMRVARESLTIADGDSTPSTADGTNFGSVALGGTAAQRVYTITNAGNSALNLSGSPAVQIVGAHAADFSVSIQPSTSVSAGGSTTFSVSFNPRAVGTRSATVLIVNDDPRRNPYEFNIQGTGTPTLASRIELFGSGESIANGDTAPSSADGTEFGSTAAAAGAVTRTFTIANNGNTALSLTGTPLVAIGGDAAADFSLTALPASSIAAAGQTTFQITFDPTAVGTRTATVSIASSDSTASPFTFTVRGTGVSGSGAPDIDLSSFTGVPIADGDDSPTTGKTTDFGRVPITNTTASSTYVITNFGYSTLHLSSSPRVQLSGANAGDFEVTIQPPDHVDSFTNVTFEVTFDPRAGGVRTATASIVSDDPDEAPYTFDLQGEGVAANANVDIDLSSFTAVSIADGDTAPDATKTTDFGTLAISGGLGQATFVISNFGTESLHLNGAPRVQIIGPQSYAFRVSTPPPNLVPAGTNRTFEIAFDPVTAGLHQATVSIASDDPDESPYTFAIQGTGTTFGGLVDIDLSSMSGTPIALGDLSPSVAKGTDFGTVLIGNTATSDLVITNFGTNPLTLNATPAVSIINSSTSEFRIAAQPASTIPGMTNTVFRISFQPTGPGARVAQVVISSTDPDEAVYTFLIRGVGATA